jgi:hypothetical protein
MKNKLFLVKQSSRITGILFLQVETQSRCTSSTRSGKVTYATFKIKYFTSTSTVSQMDTLLMDGWLTGEPLL